jgi:hypothetical protein
MLEGKRLFFVSLSKHSTPSNTHADGIITYSVDDVLAGLLLLFAGLFTYAWAPISGIRKITTAGLDVENG